MSVSSGNPTFMHIYVLASQEALRTAAPLEGLVQQRAAVASACDRSPSGGGLQLAIAGFNGMFLTHTFLESVRGALMSADNYTGSGTTSRGDVEIEQVVADRSAAVQEILADVLAGAGRHPASGFAGDPVNAANGNFLHQDVDLQLPGRAEPMSLVRTYNSLRADLPGIFGRGWTCMLDMVLHAGAGGSAPRVVLADGAEITFDVGDEPGAEWRSTNRPRWSLRREPDGGWILTDTPLSSTRFDADGTLQAMTSPTSLITVERSPDLLTMTEAHSGRRISVELTDGVAVAARASDGRTCDYAHDATGLIQARTPGATTRYSHDAAGRIHTVVDADGVIHVDNTYDDRNRVTEQTTLHGGRNTFAYGAKGVTVVETGEGGPRNIFVHDGRGRLTALYDGAQGVARQQWDDQDEIIRTTDRAGHVTRIERDGHGLPVRIEHPDGGVESWTRDDVGRIIAHTDVAGITTSQEFADDTTVPVRITTPFGATTAVAVDGGVVAMIDADGVEQTIERDSDGMPISWQLAGRPPTRVHRDAAGRPLREEVDGRVIRQVRRDDAGRVVAIGDGEEGWTTMRRTPAGRVASVRTASGLQVDVRRDACGRIATIEDLSGVRLQLDHDELGQVVSVSRDGRRLSLDHDRVGRLLAVEEDDRSLLSQSFDADGRLTSTATTRGRTSVEQWRDGGTATNQWGGTQRWRCQPGGRLVQTIDPSGGTSTMTWRDSARPATVTDPHGATTSLHWSPAGRLVGLTSAEGRALRLDYDETGRLDRVGDADGLLWPPPPAVAPRPEALSATQAFWADDRGVPVRHTDAAGVTTSLPLQAPRPPQVTVSRDLGSRTADLVGPQGRTLARTEHDLAGRVVAEHMDGHSTSWTWDARGQLAHVDGPFDVLSIDRDADGLVTGLEHEANGQRHELQVRRSPAGRITGHHDAVLGDLGRPHGRLVRTDGQGAVWDADGRRHTFDEAGRLTSTRLPDGTLTTWGYDEMTGALAVERCGADVRRLTHDALGRLQRVDEADGAWRIFTYDDRGRRTGETTSTGTTVTYTWDVLDRLIAVDHDGREQHQITYDGGGRPVRIGDATIGWDDALTGKAIRIGEQVHARHGLAVRPLVEGGRWTHGVGDDPWGADDGEGVRLGFRGEVALDSLVFLGTRVYDTSTRCFLSPDPLPAVVGMPCAKAPYHLGWNDPVRMVDPTGLRPVSEEAYTFITEVAGSLGWRATIAMVTDAQWGQPSAAPDAVDAHGDLSHFVHMGLTPALPPASVPYAPGSLPPPPDDVWEPGDLIPFVVSSTVSEAIAGAIGAGFTVVVHGTPSATAPGWLAGGAWRVPRFNPVRTGGVVSGGVQIVSDLVNDNDYAWWQVGVRGAVQFGVGVASAAAGGVVAGMTSFTGPGALVAGGTAGVVFGTGLNAGLEGLTHDSSLDWIVG